MNAHHLSLLSYCLEIELLNYDIFKTMIILNCEDIIKTENKTEGFDHNVYLCYLNACILTALLRCIVYFALIKLEVLEITLSFRLYNFKC